MDIVWIYLKQVIASDPALYSDPIRLTKVVDDSIELNNQIIQMHTFINQIAHPLIIE